MLIVGEWTGWPSGENREVLDVALTIDDLRTRYGLNPIPGEDDLGPFRAAHFADAVIGPVVIYRYDNEHVTKATILVDKKVDPRVAIHRIREVMELRPREILASLCPLT